MRDALGLASYSPKDNRAARTGRGAFLFFFQANRANSEYY